MDAIRARFSTLKIDKLEKNLEMIHDIVYHKIPGIIVINTNSNNYSYVVNTIGTLGGWVNCKLRFYQDYYPNLRIGESYPNSVFFNVDLPESEFRSAYPDIPIVFLKSSV